MQDQLELHRPGCRFAKLESSWVSKPTVVTGEGCRLDIYIFFTVDIDTRHQELGHDTCYKAISTTHSVSIHIHNRHNSIHSH